MNSCHLPKLKEQKKTWEDAVGKNEKQGRRNSLNFLERENFSLEIHAIGPWISTEQERKTFYAEQATHGPRFCEFLTTPRGRIFSLLAFYSHF